MPLFDFVCEDCQHPFEDMHRGDDPLPVCPKCGSAKTEKRLSIGSAFIPIVLKPNTTYDFSQASKKKRRRTYNF